MAAWHILPRRLLKHGQSGYESTLRAYPAFALVITQRACSDSVGGGYPGIKMSDSESSLRTIGEKNSLDDLQAVNEVMFPTI